MGLYNRRQILKEKTNYYKKEYKECPSWKLLKKYNLYSSYRAAKYLLEHPENIEK